MTADQDPSVSIVIPVLNAEAFLPRLLDAIFSQTLRPVEVVLVDSMSKDATREIAEQYDAVRVIPIENFSHGRGRNLGVRAARGEFVVLMTQDALPRDADWLVRLLEPFEDPQVAASYSRQVAGPAASPMEQYFLMTHFPPGPPVRRVRQEGESLTLDKVFFSNVSAAVRRELLLKYPFDEELIMSEDQQMSRDVMNAGYAVVYAPDSVVVHYHSYTLRVLFRRYLDSVHSLTVIFPDHGVGTSASLGLGYLWREACYVARKAPLMMPYYVLFAIAKAAGTVTGHLVPYLPRWLLRRISLHDYHWAQK